LKTTYIKNRRHIFFDLDDTLWDYETNSAKVLNELYAEHDLQTKLKVAFQDFLPVYRKVNKEMWLQYSYGEITKQQLRDERFSNTFGYFSYSDPLLNAALTKEFLSRTPRETCLKEGCHEVLSYLKSKYTLHIITNGFNDVQSIKIEGGRLRSYFDNIIVSEDHALNKPDTRIFRLAEQMAKARPEECVMIGDTYESDIMGAINAGWEALYYNRHPAPSYEGKVITSLKDLLELF
jgi:putative hydrolase of the HAD superfamily